MASIIGEKKYKNAADTSSGGWAVTDKIFGYLDEAGNIYNKIRYPQPGDPDYYAEQARLRQLNAGMFGLPRPWGGVLLIGGVTFLAVMLYRIAK